MRRDEVPALTGIRFIAAMSVVAAHSASLGIPVETRTSVQYWMATCSGFGMSLFFVLSGFVIHYNYRHFVSERGTIGVSQFFWARFCRLYPLFLLIFLIDVLIGPPLYEGVGLYGLFSRNTESLDSILRAAPFFLTFVHSWLYKVIDGHSLIYQIGWASPLSWSISTEWFFYLCYPVLCVALIRLKRPAAILAAAIGVSVVWLSVGAMLVDHAGSIEGWAVNRFGDVASSKVSTQDSFMRWLLYFSPYARIGEFILGALAAQLYEVCSSRAVTRIESRVAGAILVCALLSIPTLVFLKYGAGTPATLLARAPLAFVLAPSIVVLVFAAARYRSLFARILSSRFMVFGGQASYSIYLIHIIVLLAVSKATPQTVTLNPGAPLFITVRLLFVLAIIVLLSAGLYAVYEAPARRFLRSLFPSSAKSIPAIAALLFFMPVALAAASILWAQQLADENPDRDAAGVQVMSATYGGNCGASTGNVTEHVRRACRGRQHCRYVVDVQQLGDSAPNCGKDFVVTYGCPGLTAPRRVDVPGEAGFRTEILLACEK